MVKKLRERPDRQSEQTNQKPNNKFKNNTNGSEPLFSVAEKVLLAIPMTLSVLALAGVLGFILPQKIKRRKVYAENCLMHNDTTIKINRKTDGKIIKPEELGFFPGGMEQLIDFVNETHAISTERLPDDVKLTLVSEQCDYWWIRGYAHLSSRPLADEGIYLKNRTVEVGRDNTLFALNHEIGHLQPGGSDNEVIPQLNVHEQSLMGYVVFSNQPDKQLPENYLHYSLSMLNLYESVILLQAGEPLGGYRKADIFIFNKLAELEGDFAALRNEIIKLRKNGELSDAVDSEAVKFIDEYSEEPSKAACYEKINKKLKHAYYLELKRRFEPSIAEEFLNDDSFFPDPDRISLGDILIVDD